MMQKTLSKVAHETDVPEQVWINLATYCHLDYRSPKLVADILHKAGFYWDENFHITFLSSSASQLTKGTVRESPPACSPVPHVEHPIECYDVDTDRDDTDAECEEEELQNEPDVRTATVFNDEQEDDKAETRLYERDEYGEQRDLTTREVRYYLVTLFASVSILYSRVERRVLW